MSNDTREQTAGQMPASAKPERMRKRPPKERLLEALDWIMGPDFWRNVSLDPADLAKYAANESDNQDDD